VIELDDMPGTCESRPAEEPVRLRAASALVTNIQGYSIHDGPGIRTVVFLKGCGLECWWCSNPECISARPEIGFLRTLCGECGECGGVCPNGALVAEAGQVPRIDRQRCSGCGTCASACSRGALVLYGKPMTVDEVFAAVKGDKMFYDASGGGVTISGGEPLLRPGFVRSLFEQCREAGIHTCLETSGYAGKPALAQVLSFTDYVLYDLKLQDSRRHREYAGKANTLIRANAIVAARSGVEVLFRMPLIPGINDGDENIAETAAFLRSLGDPPPGLQLMPYHRFGTGKYESLDRPYHLGDVPSPAPESTARILQAFEAHGLACTVSE
jgi:pyruvate formate lyase activating enzyme